MKSITIVGGGTAGWLATAYFSSLFHDLKITIIDKEVGNPIGVGEATVLTFPGFLHHCDLDIPQWFKAIDATYKSGILFPDWKKEGTNIWHPFFVNKSYFRDHCTQFDIWSQKQDKPFNLFGTSALKTSLANKCDFPVSYDNYAYHIDCGKLVIELQKQCAPYIDIIKSDVVQVNKNDKGDVVSLDLKDGTKHYADFFIDCTGFNQILKKSERVELMETGRLFANTAVAGHVQYEDKQKECKPYVECPAVEHGWIWKIPVQSRIGTGMVFNRDITDVDTAKQYFSDHWDGRIKPEEMKVIDWTPYYSKTFWENNVCSIGLSGGFIEPLESTGIASMTEGVQRLALRLNTGRYDQTDIDIYNAEMRYWYEDAVDFVSSHYADTERTSKFWDYVKDNHIKSEKHIYYEKWLKDPSRKFYTKNSHNTLFHPPNWQLWLVQMGYTVNKDMNYLDPMRIDQLMKEWDDHEDNMCKRSIPHLDAVELTNRGYQWR